MKQIEQLYHECAGIPGYRMMQDLLKKETIFLSVQTVRKYMNVELHLKSITRKPKYRYRKSPATDCVASNLLNRNFTAAARNTKWCIDFTYLYFGNQCKRYNCTIIDLYDRRVVASVNGNRMNTRLAIAAVTVALEANPGATGMILHSDRGSQFTSKEFIDFCKEHEIQQSMSRPGCPYDNSPMERYFNTLKAELLYLHRYPDEETLYRELNCYAYGWYNNRRPHTFNNGLPPTKVA